jgi:hypothetical protein
MVNSAALYLALEQCEREIRPMQAFVDEATLGHVKRPKRTSVKVALSTSRLAEFQAHFDSAKLTLNTCISVTGLLFS